MINSNASNARRSSSQSYSNQPQSQNLGSNYVQQNGSTNVDQPSPGCLVVKQYGLSSTAGNVGRTGTSKINQDSVFVSKITSDGRALTAKEQMKQGSLKTDWFCAVADGHGANGHFVSQFIAQHMPKQYEQEKRRIDRQKQAKDLVSNFSHKNQENGSPSTAPEG